MNKAAIRPLILAILAVVSLFVPIPDDLKGTIADHATNAVAGALGVWAAVDAWRARKQSKTP